MKKICVIPARGGSKRIPHKNIIDFMGKPLISWTIEAAQKSLLFDRVLVSTDDPMIAEIARSLGCEVPFLRDSKMDDYSPVSEATIRAINQAENYYSEIYEDVVQLMPNVPLRTAEDVINHFNNFITENHVSQISSFRFGWMNPWWSFKFLDNGTYEYMLPEGVRKRSQDLPSLFCPTGAIWIAKRDELLESNSFYMRGQSFCEMHWSHAVDIDDLDDLMFARSVFHMLYGG